jgi:hypothetical protein
LGEGVHFRGFARLAQKKISSTPQHASVKSSRHENLLFELFVAFCIEIDWFSCACYFLSTQRIISDHLLQLRTNFNWLGCEVY